MAANPGQPVKLLVCLKTQPHRQTRATLETRYFRRFDDAKSRLAIARSQGLLVPLEGAQSHLDVLSVEFNNELNRQLDSANRPTQPTVVPSGVFGFLTLRPTGGSQPLVSTLNAVDGAITANAAIVPAGNAGSISAYVQRRCISCLISMDISPHETLAGSSQSLGKGLRCINASRHLLTICSR